MPREFSRLTLTVTDVRVQRLQDICADDALDEGHNGGGWVDPRDLFHMAWDARHPNPAHQWGANPFVCALTWDVDPRNIDEVTTCPH